MRQKSLINSIKFFRSCHLVITVTNYRQFCTLFQVFDDGLMALWMVNRNLTTGLGSINVQHTTRIGKLLPPGVSYRVVGARV